MRVAVALFLLLGASCSSLPRPPPSPAPPAEWPAPSRAALNLVQRLLELDTSAPVGRTRALRRLALPLEERGFEIELSPTSLYAHRGAPSVLLLAHVDTWPADAAAWARGRGPWSGAIAQSRLHGRGALGGKGAAALYVQALAELAAVDPERAERVAVVITASGLDPRGPDLAALLRAHPELSQVEAVLKPGGYILDRGDAPSVLVLGSGELGFAFVQITAVGQAAPYRLGRAIGELDAALPPPRVGPAALRYLEDLAAVSSWPDDWVMRAPPLARTFYLDRLAEAPHTRQLVRTSARVGFSSAPAALRTELDRRAHAWAQFFLQDEQTPAGLRARLRARLGRGLHVDLMDGADATRMGFRPPKQLRAPLGDLPVVRVMTEASQARLMIEEDIPTFGLVPYALDEASLATRGGQNERLPLDALRRGFDRMLPLLRSLSSTISADR